MMKIVVVVRIQIVMAEVVGGVDLGESEVGVDELGGIERVRVLGKMGNLGVGVGVVIQLCSSSSLQVRDRVV